jgi:flagellar FliJ protein
MLIKQLDILIKFEKEKESQAAQKLKTAELEHQQNITRLTGVSDYRLEYMKRLSQRATEGIDSATYTHYHAFIAKLDNASEQVRIAMVQAKALSEQYKDLWMKQRQKVKAVEHLRDKQLRKIARVADINEQKMFDEISNQQFIRRRR